MLEIALSMDKDIEIWKKAISFRIGDLRNNKLVFNSGKYAKWKSVYDDIITIFNRKCKDVPNEFLNDHILGFVKLDGKGYHIRVMGNPKLAYSFSQIALQINSIPLKEIDNMKISKLPAYNICKIINIATITSQERAPVFKQYQYPPNITKELRKYLDNALNEFCKKKFKNKYKEECYRLISNLKGAINKHLMRTKRKGVYQMLNCSDGIALWLGNLCEQNKKQSELLERMGIPLEYRHDVIIYPINYLPVVPPYFVSRVIFPKANMILFLVSPVTEMYTSASKEKFVELQKLHCIFLYSLSDFINTAKNFEEDAIIKFLREWGPIIPGFSVVKRSREERLKDILERVSM